MKKTKFIISLIILAVLTCLAICISGCAKKYTVKYLAAEGGSVSGETTQMVSAHKDTTAVAVEPDDGYYFNGWSDGDGHFVRTDKDVTSDITVTAQFKRRTFTVQYISGSYGSIQGESSQTVNMYDNSTEVTAIPNEGYEFVGWSDDVAEATRYEESVEQNILVYAKFVLKAYRVKFSAGEHGTIEGDSEQTVKYGKNNSTVTAKPEWGYVFAGWSDGVQTATRSDNVTAEINATAYFKRGFEGGDGSVKNPFTISTYEQFCNIVFYPAEYFKLLCDLDLTGISHRPLFEEDKPTVGGVQPFDLNDVEEVKNFSGEFDGCGHAIKNLTVNCDSQYPSLLGVLNEGFVKNLKIENAHIKTRDYNTAGGKHYYVGILAGALNGFAKNITVSGEIIADGLTHDGVAIGGIAGQAFYPMIGCTTNVDIKASNIVSNYTRMTNPFCFGGLAGICSSWSVADCKAEGTITVNNSETINNKPNVCVGGLIGYCFGSEDDDIEEELGATIRIVNSHSDVDIVEDNSEIDVGGFIGDLATNEAEISECSSSGQIRAKAASGFLFSVSSKRNSFIEKCRSDCDLECANRAYGFARTIQNLTFSECYVGGSLSAGGYVSGFFNLASNVIIKDCCVESELDGMYACGFGYMASRDTVLDRCRFIGSVKCSKVGSGICFMISNATINNCYSTGNINVDNMETSDEILWVGGICARSDNSEIKNSYFAGMITIEGDYPSDSHLGIFVGRSSNSVITNCHTLCRADSEIKNVIGASLGTTNECDIVSYASIEDMFNIADVLNAGQEEIVWQNVNNALPEFVNNESML